MRTKKQIIYFFPFGRTTRNFPDHGSNPCPLQWKRGVLTAGPPGKSYFKIENQLISAKEHSRLRALQQPIQRHEDGRALEGAGFTVML